MNGLAIRWLSHGTSDRCADSRANACPRRGAACWAPVWVGLLVLVGGCEGRDPTANKNLLPATAHPGSTTRLAAGQPDAAEPAPQQPATPPTAADHLPLARQLLDQHRPAEALVVLWQAAADEGEQPRLLEAMAEALEQQQRWAEALAMWCAVAQAEPNRSGNEAHCTRLAQQTRTDSIPPHFRCRHADADLERWAADRFKTVAQADPELLNQTAWTLATHADPRLRDAALALLAAQTLLRHAGAEPEYMDTLAAAYAQAGQWSEAAALQRRAVENFPLDGPVEERLAYQQRLERYRQRQSFLETDDVPLGIHWDAAPRARRVAAALVLAGLRRLADDQQDAAAAAFAEAIEWDSSCAAAHALLGDVLLTRGHLEEAVREYAAVLWLRPRDAETLVRLGFVRHQAGWPTMAMGYYAAALRLDPRSVDAANNLAWLLVAHPIAARRDPRRAVELAEQAARAAGAEDTECLDTLATAYAAAGRFDEAEAVLQRALRRLPPAGAGQAGRLRMKAQLLGQGRWSGNLSQGLVESAAARSTAGKADEARHLLEQALADDPTDPRAHLELGALCEAHREYRAALTHYGQAALLQPDHPEPLIRLARIYCLCRDPRIRKVPLAVQLAQQAVALNEPPLPAHQYILALAHAAAGQADEAARVVDAALAASTNGQHDPAVLDSLRRLQQCLAEDRRPPEQQWPVRDPQLDHVPVLTRLRAEALDEALRRCLATPRAGWPEAMHELAWILAAADAAQREPASAQQLIDGLIAREPTNADYWNTLAVVRAAAGNASGAIDALRRSAELALGRESADDLLLRRELLNLFQQGQPYEDPNLVQADVPALPAEDRLARLVHAHRRLAARLRRRGELDLAGAVLEQALAFDGGQRELHLQRAEVLAQQGNLAATAEHLVTALQMQWDDAAALTRLGEVRQMQGRLELAMAYWREALRQKPHPPAALSLAHALATADPPHVRDPAEAIRIAEQLCRSQPDDPACLEVLAIACAAAGRFEKAKSAAGRALDVLRRTTPRNPQAVVACEDRLALFALNKAYRNPWQMHLDLARHAAAANDTVTLERHLYAAHAAFPADVQTLLDLAVLEIEQRRFAAAAAMLREALARQPDRLDVANDLAWLLATCPDESVRDGRRAVELAERVCQISDRRDPYYLDTLAAAYAEVGRYAEAVTALGEAKSRCQPTHPPEMAGDLERRRRSYEASRPWREPATEPALSGVEG